MSFAAKYPGRCTRCAKAITIGTLINWDRLSRTSTHVNCVDPLAPQRAAAQAIEASRAATIEQAPAEVAVVATSIPCPEGLDYLPFQRVGIATMLQRPASLLGDEMGTGKSIEIVGVINGDPTIRTVLVVCPASLRINWQRELVRWSVRPTTVTILTGTKASAEVVTLALAGDGVRVLVLNYDILHAWAPILREIAFDLLAADEAHMLKNPNALRTKALVGTEAKGRGAARKPGEPGIRARRRILATGTPIVNRPVEAWPLIHYLDPTGWPKKWTYLTRYCGAVQTRWGWDFTGATNLAELQQKLRSTILLRRLRKDVLKELPAKRRQVVVIPASGASAVVDAESRAWACHEETLERLRANVELSKASADPADYQEAVSQLQEAAKAAFSEISKLRHDTAVAKVPYVSQHVIDALEESGKVVLFAHHMDVHKALYAGLDEAGMNPVILTGDTSMADRQAAVDRFQTDPSCRVFIGAIQAAGVGITLTSASHVVFAELDWAPGNVTQCEDRCVRIGATADMVLVQHLVLDGSLDARMATVLVEKQDVLDRALDRVTEVAMDPTVPAIPGGKPASDSATRRQIEAEAATLTPSQVQAIHQGLKLIAAMCDGARQLDQSGFSKVDAHIGHSLAESHSLTPRQAALGMRLCRRYRRQLGEVLPYGAVDNSPNQPSADAILLGQENL